MIKLPRNLLKGIFISLFAVLLMSHNTSAMGAYIPNTAIGRFKTSFSSNFDGNDNCSTTNPAYLNRIRTTFDPLALSPDSDYIVSMTFFNSANSNSFDGKIPIAWRSFWEGIFTIRDVELQSTSPSQFTLYMVIHTATNIAGGAANNIYLDFYSDDYMILYQNECVSNWGWLTRVTWSGDDAIINYTGLLNDIASKLNNIQNSQPTQQQITNLNNSVNNLNDAVSEHYRKEDAAVNNIQNQNTSDIGNSTNQKTESLLGIFGGFINAVRAANATNCNIPANWGNLNLGTLNLCRDQPPTFVQVIGSLVAIAVFVPCAYWLVMRILSEIRSFTNG